MQGWTIFFFASKIRAVAEQLGLNVLFARSDQGLIESARSEAPVVIVLDLHSQKFRPMDLARQVKSDPALNSISIVGFFSHVESELQATAVAAGFDRVLPRSAFTNQLADILSGK